MKTNTARGFRRLAILAGILAGAITAAAILLDILTHGTGSAPVLLLAAFTIIATTAAAAAAWGIVRGFAWVCAGFTARRVNFPAPGKN